MNYACLLNWYLRAVSESLVTVFKNTFPCQSFYCLVLQFCGAIISNTASRLNSVTVALVYRPPKQNMDFLNEFAAFAGNLIAAHDKILLLGILIIMSVVCLKPYPWSF